MSGRPEPKPESATIATGVALPLLNRDPITYESAINKDGDMFKKLKFPAENEELYSRLWHERSVIEALTRHHLGLGSKGTITVAPRDDWLRGGFNVCIPVDLDLMRGQSLPRRLLFRCPLPYKLAEACFPGTIDEKLGGEVGTYAWMQDHCPDIRIPHLYGFGFSDGCTFTHVSQRPWYIRIAIKLKCILLRLFRHPVPSAYVSNPASSSSSLSSAYILLERIEPEIGQMLAATWNQKRNEPAQRKKLFQGIARTMLSLARFPQPQIGSFRFHDNGTISLTNRPLTSATVLLENDGAPRTIQRHNTYTCTESYVSDLLTFHDNAFLSNRNAVFGEKICKEEMAVKTILRALAHRYIRRESRTGPFLLQFTDLHIGNIFVDDEWNVTCFIDLEWVCALPAEQLAVPYWVTGRDIDQLSGDHLDEFNKIGEEFMLAFEEEEEKVASAHHDLPLGRIMRDMWKTGGMWFWYSVDSVNAAYWLVFHHLMPRFTSQPSRARDPMSEFWCEESASMVERKMAEYKSYERELQTVFGQVREDTGPSEVPEAAMS